MVSRLTGICHVNLASGYSGGERQTEILVRELGRRGIAQRLVVTAGSGLAERCGDVPNLDARVVSGNLLGAALAIRGCRVAHAHDGRGVYATLAAWLFFKIPYLVTRRVVTGKAMSGLRGYVYGHAARIAAVSQATADDMTEHGVRNDVVVVPDAHSALPADEQAVSRIRADHVGKTLIVHAGMLDHSAKGQSTIIEVARRVSAKHPDWHFLLCGEGKDRARFESEIGALSNIELVGWVDNIGDYLAASDLLVFPSLKEALGSTILDAMHAGLPIVATRVGGIPEFVEDGVNGRLVEPEAPEQLQAAIEEVLADADELTAMRARNIGKSRRYGATRMADAYETLYREITAQV